MSTYDETMRLGQAEYQDVIDSFEAQSLALTFIQTGGMNAALLGQLEGGVELLITDADDSLSWRRAEKTGWGVGLYRDDVDGPLVDVTTQDGSTEALRAALHEATRFLATRPRRRT